MIFVIWICYRRSVTKTEKAKVLEDLPKTRYVCYFCLVCSQLLRLLPFSLYIYPIDLFYPLVSLLTHADCRLHAHAVNVIDDDDSVSPCASSLVFPFVSNIFLLTNDGCRLQVPAVNTNDDSDSNLPTISSWESIILVVILLLSPLTLCSLRFSILAEASVKNTMDNKQAPSLSHCKL